MSKYSPPCSLSFLFIFFISSSSFILFYFISFIIAKVYRRIYTWMFEKIWCDESIKQSSFNTKIIFYFFIVKKSRWLSYVYMCIFSDNFRWMKYLYACKCILMMRHRQNREIECVDNFIETSGRTEVQQHYSFSRRNIVRHLYIILSRSQFSNECHLSSKIFHRLRL